MSVTVYGASDDLIEVEGDVRAEFSALGAESNVLGFSDGTVLRVAYTSDGIWRVSPLTNAAGVTIDFAEGPDSDNYSDRATLHGSASWVVIGTEWARAAS